jgi:hypothetical protein
MDNWKFTSIVFAVLCGLSHQAAAQPQQRAVATGTATVSGRVTLKGEPARDVTVYLQSQRGAMPSNPNEILRAKSGEDGRFRITGVKAGSYYVIALAPGFASLQDGNFALRGNTVNVSEGEEVENIDVELKRGGVITGRVTDSQGRPLIEERITLNTVDRNGKAQPNYFLSGQNYEMFQTDDRGEYRIYSLPPGRYLVSIGAVSSPGNITVMTGGRYYSRTFHPDATKESDAKPIEISEGSEIANVDITVSGSFETRAINGRLVSAETGQPVAGVEIAFGSMMQGSSSIGAWGSNGTITRANGEFTLRGLVPGKYAIFARPESSNEIFAEPVMCDVSASDVDGVEIRTRQGGSINGVVVIEGVSGPQVAAKLSRVMIFTSVKTDRGDEPGRTSPKINPDGTFRISGLPPGRVSINPQPVTPATGLSLVRIERDGAHVRGEIEIGPGERITGVRIVLAHGALSLRGELKIIGGVLPANLRLFASARRTDQSTPSSSFGAEVDTRGKFVIENLTPGEYEIRCGVTVTAIDRQVDMQVAKAVSAIKERVVVSSDNQQTVTITIDLGRKE